LASILTLVGSCVYMHQFLEEKEEVSIEGVGIKLPIAKVCFWLFEELTCGDPTPSTSSLVPSPVVSWPPTSYSSPGNITQPSLPPPIPQPPSTSIPMSNAYCEQGTTLLSDATPGITGVSDNRPNELCGAHGVPTDMGAWYSYVGEGTMTTVTTCSQGGATHPPVYTSSCVCVEESERYAGNEEATSWYTSYDCPSGTTRSAVSWYPESEEEYHIWVHDMGGDPSRFEIIVRRQRRLSGGGSR
jgi:hypothetical protein